MSDHGLFGGFGEVSAKQWKQKIQYDLQGADYNQSLVWESLEGIKVKPFYHGEDLEGLETFPQRGDRPWKIIEPVYGGGPAQANGLARSLLKKGTDGLIFTLPGEDTDLESLLSGIQLQGSPLYFDLHYLAPGPIKELCTRLQGHRGTIHLGLDPIGQLAREGHWHRDGEKDLGALAEITERFDPGDGSTLLEIGMDHYQNAGANMVQQLAYALAHAHEYLHHFRNRGGGAMACCFKVAVGGNYFFEIAKLRALRWLWASLAPEYGPWADCHILATPSRRNKTLYDYNVNLLSTNSECMSALLGGADALCKIGRAHV